jgi:hypothetical protein
MSEIVKSRYQGILVPDERFSLDKLTASDHAAAPSSYSQAGPKPGIPEANDPTRMVLQSSGEQSAGQAIKIMTTRAGHPGLERGGFVWQDFTEADPADFGWDGPQLLSGWGSLFSSTDNTEKSAIPDMIRLQSGYLLALGTQDKTTFAQDVSRYNPDAATLSAGWSTVGAITLDSAEAQKGPALLQLPSGRVLAYFAVVDQVDCYYSDDDGASWGPYSYRALDVAVGNSDIRQIRAEYSGGEVLLLVQWNTGGGAESCAQYASDDLGGRFTQIVADWATDTSENPEAIDIVQLDGEFLVVYHDGDAGTPKYYSRRISSAFTNITDATANEIAAGAGSVFVPGCTAWRDDSGIVYSYCHTTGTGRDLTPRRSDDNGDTWTDFSETAFFSGLEGEGYLHSYVAREVAGRVVVLTRWEADGSSEDPQSLAAVYVGGYGKHTAPAGAGTTGFFDTDYVAYAKDFGSNTGGGSYLPVSLPDQVNWTATGTGTSSLTSSLLKFDTNGNTRFFSRALSSGNEEERVFFEIALSIDSGDGSLTAQEISAQLRIADAGSFEYEAAINLSSAGFAVYDLTSSAQVGSNVSASLHKPTHIRVAMEKGYIRTWYASEDHFSEWQEGPAGSLANAGATANASAVVWGHIASPAAQTISRWTMVGYCFWPREWGPASSSFASAWFTPEDLHSKSYSVSPQQLRDKTSFAAVAGPTRLDEEWLIETDYNYPARSLFPANASSPRAVWRSTDTTEQILAWDISGLAYARMENSSLACVLLGINFKTAVLEKKTGGVWSTVCTINAAEGFESLRFTRDGEIVLPETGGSAHKAGRYIMYDELSGGTFYDATNTKHRKIAENTEGAWTDEAAKHPFVTLTGADDTEATAGACEIWAPNAAGLAHSYTSDARFYRLRIPAQTTADGYFEIGQMVVGPLAVFGSQYGRGRQIVARNNTEQINLPNGEVRARKRGPQAREVEFAWTTGVDATQINQADPVPDYVAAGVGQEPMASLKDTLYLMDGVIRRQGGAGKPVVYFARITADSTDDQTNNPREFVYGRITGNATRSNILGDEEKTDLDRLNTITIQELV